MTCRPTSLNRFFAVSLGKAAFVLAVVLAWGVPFALGGGFDMPERATDEQVMEIRPSHPGSPAALIEQHNCWTGEAPADMAGKAPGHVVVSPEAKAPRYAGAGLVAKALAQTFNGVDHGLTVHGFCR